MKSKKVMELYSEEFMDIFQVSLKHFQSRLRMRGIWDFDIIIFDEFIHKRDGYEEKKHGSLKSFISKKYGEKAVKFLRKLF